MAKKRANGEGSIRRKPNGRWEGRYTLGIDPATGRAIQKSVSAKTRAECKEKLAKAIRDNRGIPVNHNEDYTVAEWCRLWFETYSKPVIRPNTAKTYENMIENHIVPAIGGVKLKRLTAIQIQKMYNDSKTKGRVQRFETQTIASSICSRAALREVQRCLELVCTQGTASLYFKDSTRLRVAAKTGTAQITDARSREGRYYLGSMVAYFPADNPRYTVLTTIETRAQPGKAYYGGPLAGPVVKRMVDYIYNRNRDWYGRVERHGGRCYPGHVKGGDIAQIRRVADKFSPRASFDQRTGWGRARVDSLSNVIITSLPPETGTMPDVRGMGLKDALFVLESRGLKVRFSGAGAVTQQSIPAGARITPGSTVGITLK